MAAEPKIRTVNIFLGFFFVVNFCLGTGFLGVPYAFFYSGYLAAIPSLLIITLISWINANYLLEVMARAQGLEYYEKAQRPSGLDSDSDDADQLININTSRQHPIFEITVRRKFEVLELCEIFFNKWVKYLYLAILSVYCFLASWSLATVAGSSWALNIPYNFSRVVSCDSTSEPFHHSILPTEETCRNAYYFSLFLFAVLVVSLSLLDLKEQAIIQMILGLMRFFTVGAIVVYSIAKIAEGGDACVDREIDSNITLYPNSSNIPFYELTNATAYTKDLYIFAKFNPTSWLTAVPVITYAFIFHQGIASLTHPIKQKQYMWYLIAAMFSTAAICYMTLGLVVPLWFKFAVQENVTLNFSELTSSRHSLALRILSYYLLLFPSLDVVSAYPLMIHTVVSSLYIILVGRDTSKPPPEKYKWLDFALRMALRLIVAVLPILAAFSVANLVYVLKYAGLMGFNICFFFPTALQLRSVYVCKRKFAPSHISVSGTHHHNEEEQSLLSGAIGNKIVASKGQSVVSPRHLEGKEKRQPYMTPYSSVLFSHPIAAVVVGCVGFFFFVLTLASLGVHPEELTC